MGIGNSKLIKYKTSYSLEDIKRQTATLLNLTQFTPGAFMHLRTYHRQTKIVLKFPFEVKLKSTTFIEMFLGSGGGGSGAS